MTIVSSEQPSGRIFQDVGKDWLPLHVAPFFFFPEYAEQSRYAHRMIELLESLAPPDSALEFRQGEDDCITVEKDGVVLVIEAAEGEFRLAPLHLDDMLDQVTDGLGDPTGRPDDFFSELDSISGKPEYAAAVSELGDFAKRVWEALSRRFLTAIKDGNAEIYGRWLDLDADFRRLHYDQWAQFSIESSYNQNEFSDEYGLQSWLVHPRTEEIVHSIYVMPVRQQRHSKSSPEEKAATEWLANRVRQRPDLPEAKGTIWKVLTPLFPEVSYDGFKRRVWPDAIEQSNAPRWRKAGNRPGSRLEKSSGASVTSIARRRK